jgi:hypothetical protein
MTLHPQRAFQVDPSWNHPDPAVYEAFVLNYTNKAWRRQRLLRAACTFIIWYPRLLDWFSADLRERVGCLPYEKPPDMTNAASYNARFYLVFLAWRGYVRFDWDWLLAIRHLRFNEADLAEFNQGIEQLVQTATGLGYRPVAV